ncbi:MAG: ribonuclease HII [Sulfuricurvum sp.]|jgi:ribonuclease HII|uniref:ribonuclease HII n=1 Tax=Sulfuricurvum sp. TaxID=2025608 RepID=UPI0025EB8702|nr:ribonuclease HII [Sulfuricurvum sp.]MCI4406161.1 ribonuclease HII [Sulfuricurvum sp.]
MLLCGIDEAGRGPLAGPLYIAGVILDEVIEGLGDSKKLSERKREALFDEIRSKSRFHISRFSPEQIDTLGISKCLSAGLREIMEALGEADYLYDGNSKFGVSGIRTMIKADATIPEVSAASILAKVTRDREMVELAPLYPQYGFEGHKGYGCASHIEAIRQYGYCEIHRKSFKLKALQPSLF